MIRAFFWSKKWALWAYGGGFSILLLIYAQVYMAVLLNKWYRSFYDNFEELAAEKITAVEGLARFNADCWDFAYITMPWVFFILLANFLTRHYAFRWRKAITFDYLPKWRHVVHEIEGASQRIQEDTQKFATLVESLGAQVVRAMMMLIAFLPILWMLGGKMTTMTTGYLALVALLISCGGTIISWFVGWFLPKLEYNNQLAEAAFRKELVYAEDDKKHYGSSEKVDGLFAQVQSNYYRLFLHYGYFDLWVSSFGQLMVIVPYFLVGPSVFAGAITVGLLFQIVNAFNKIFDSFSVFVDNWTRITELRSIWMRLHEFEKNLRKYAPVHAV